MGSLIVTWSPLTGQGGSSTLTSSLASVMALDSTKKILFTHARTAKTVLDTIYQTSESGLTSGGMDGLHRLVKSQMLKPESIPDYTETIYVGRLDYLQSGYRDELSEVENTKYLFSILKAALISYDIVFVNLGSGFSSIATRALLKEADIVLVNLPQNKHAVTRFVNGELMPNELKERDYYIVITNYDRKATYTIKNIKRQAKIKNKVFAFPYTTDLKNAINLENLSDYYFRAKKSKKGEATHELITDIRKINDNIFHDLGYVHALVSGDEDE